MQYSQQIIVKRWIPILKEYEQTKAKYLTIEQLSEVNTLYKAKLDTKIMEQIKEKYPHLLEKPRSEKEKQSEDSKKEGKGLQ